MSPGFVGEVLQLAEAFLARTTWHVQAIRGWGSDHWALAPTLLGLVLGLLWATIWGSRAAAVLLAPVAAAWLLFNGPMEGLVLFLLDAEHGVSVADLLAVAALLAVAWRLLVRRPGGTAGTHHGGPAQGLGAGGSVTAPIESLSAGATAKPPH